MFVDCKHPTRGWIFGKVIEIEHSPIAKCSLVKVAHHGSARQAPELYRLLQPRVALIGVGADNDYGHPAPVTVALLQSLQVETFRSDRDGDVAVRLGAESTITVSTGHG